MARPERDLRARGTGPAAPPPVLVSGERTLLRSPLPEDEREYLELRRSSADFLRPWDPLPPPGADPLTPEGFRAWLAGSHGDRRVRTLLFRRSDGRLLGGIHLNEIVRGPFQNASLGYWIGAPFARRGYMREGLSLALSLAFDELGLHRLEANVRPENQASIALVRGAGFRLEGYSPRFLQIAGTWCDHERWALLAEDWRASRASG
jgi:ribosomal-protein-alanine N-acetyltransferase